MLFKPIVSCHNTQQLMNSFCLYICLLRIGTAHTRIFEPNTRFVSSLNMPSAKTAAKKKAEVKKDAALGVKKTTKTKKPSKKAAKKAAKPKVG